MAGENVLILPRSRNGLRGVLPPLPDSLRKLYCSGNYLTDLPPLPRTLTHLSCFENQLTALPPLPDGLTHLHCYNNQLTALPELPDGVEEILCFKNRLTALPELSDRLRMFDCGRNQLTLLPPLPASLKLLSCHTNQLTVLPPLPDSLTYLDCAPNPFIAPFDEFVREYNRTLNINVLRRKINDYYADQREAKRAGRNLGAFEQTLRSYETAARLFGPNSINNRHQNTPHLPNGPASVIAEFLSGKRGTLPQQVIQLKANASHIPGAPGVSRRSRKSNTRKSKARKSKARKSRK